MRILSAAAVVVLLAAGCGTSGRVNRSAEPHLPSALAHEWAARASAIAGASAAGDSCRAYQLAVRLRNDVMAAEDEVPARLQAPLVAGVNSLADRTTCTPPPAHPKKPHDDHHHKHGHHGDGGDKGDEK